MRPILPESWAPQGPFFALIGVLLAITALGWEPALRALTTPEPPPSRFLFHPKIIHPALLLCGLIIVGGLQLIVAALSTHAWLLLTTPLLLIGAWRGTLGVARWRYRRRLRTQLLLAVEQLAAMTSGSAALLTAFRSVGRAAPPPLREEWAWVERHVSVPYVADGNGPIRHSDHADALRALASQTPLELHARVLDHLAAIYEQGAESHAAPRMRRLAEVLAEQSSLRRDLTTQMGRVRGEAFVISGAMGLIAIWLLISQTERVATAFLISPFGPLALVWFVFWFALPLVAALLLTRAPELPL
jgi:Flp pilus assembly protein TadB